MSKENQGRKPPSRIHYVQDWLGDEALACCGYAAKGLWADAIDLMWISVERGVLTGTLLDIAQMTRGNVEDCLLGVLDLAWTGTANVVLCEDAEWVERTPNEAAESFPKPPKRGPLETVECYAERYRAVTRCVTETLRKRYGVTDSNALGNVLVTLVNRRQYRMGEVLSAGAVRQRKYREKQRQKRAGNGKVTPPVIPRAQYASASASASAKKQQQQQALPVAGETLGPPEETAPKQPPGVPQPAPLAVVEILHRAGLAYPLARLLAQSHGVETIPLIGMFASAPKDVKNLAGWARARIASGDWRPEGKPTTAWFVSAVKAGLVVSIGGQPVAPATIRYNATGLFVQDNGAEPRLLAATDDLAKMEIG